MKKTFLKAAIPTLAMLLVAVMALTGTTYAWFTANNTASATGINVTITTAGGLLISEDGSTWVSDLTMTGMTSDNFKACSTSCVPSGNALKFYTATLANDVSKLKANSITQTTTDFLEKTLHIKNDSNDPMTVTITGSVGGEGAAAGRLAVLYGSEVKLIVADETTEGLNGNDIDTDQPVVPVTTGVYTAQYSAITSGTVQIAAQQEVTIKVYFWLEGQDSDCVNTIAQKGMTGSLSFAGPSSN